MADAKGLAIVVSAIGVAAAYYWWEYGRTFYFCDPDEKVCKLCGEEGCQPYTAHQSKEWCDLSCGASTSQRFRCREGSCVACAGSECDTAVTYASYADCETADNDCEEAEPTHECPEGGFEYRSDATFNVCKEGKAFLACVRGGTNTDCEIPEFPARENICARVSSGGGSAFLSLKCEGGDQGVLRVGSLSDEEPHQCMSASRHGDVYSFYKCRDPKRDCCPVWGPQSCSPAPVFADVHEWKAWSLPPHCTPEGSFQVTCAPHPHKPEEGCTRQWVDIPGDGKTYKTRVYVDPTGNTSYRCRGAIHRLNLQGTTNIDGGTACLAIRRSSRINSVEFEQCPFDDCAISSKPTPPLFGSVADAPAPP